MFFFTTLGLNNEIACVSFSFKPPLGFACFDEITGLFFGKGSTATSNGNGNGHGNGWIIIFSDRNKHWQAGVECVRLNKCVFFLDLNQESGTGGLRGKGKREKARHGVWGLGFGLAWHEIEKLSYGGFDPMISMKTRKLIGETSYLSVC